MRREVARKARSEVLLRTVKLLDLTRSNVAFFDKNSKWYNCLRGEIEDPNKVNAGVENIVKDRALGEALVHIVQRPKTNVHVAEGEEQKTNEEKLAASLIKWRKYHRGKQIRIINDANDCQGGCVFAKNDEGCSYENYRKRKTGYEVSRPALFVFLAHEKVEEDEKLRSDEIYHARKLICRAVSNEIVICYKREDKRYAKQVSVLEVEEHF